MIADKSYVSAEEHSQVVEELYAEILKRDELLRKLGGILVIIAAEHSSTTRSDWTATMVFDGIRKIKEVLNEP